MEIIAYTTPTCNYCTTLVQLFERAGVEYKKIVVERDRTLSSDAMHFDTFKELYPDSVGFPYVLIDGNHVGGLVETAKLFVEKGLVSAKKK